LNRAYNSIIIDQINYYQHKDHACSTFKLGLTKTTINNARQLSCSLVGICHWREIEYERFGGRPSVGGMPGTRPAPCSPLNRAVVPPQKAHVFRRPVDVHRLSASRSSYKYSAQYILYTVSSAPNHITPLQYTALQSARLLSPSTLSSRACNHVCC